MLNADPEAAGSMLRAAQLLLRGIGEHAIRCDPDQYLRFNESMEQAAAALAESAAGPESLARAAEAIHSLEDYNRRTAQLLRVRGSELENMVKMLTGAIGDISKTSKENVARLRDIENMVSSVSQVEDVRGVRAQLAVCLEEIRKEADRQRTAASNAAGHLQNDLKRLQAGQAIDAVTGLPDRSQATELISNACESEQPAFAAVMALDRLQAVNTAFGPAAGDQVLRYFAGHVRRHLPSCDLLFRWTGASFLALIVREDRIEALRREIGSILDQKLECTVRTATRSVRLPVTARWALFPMMPSSRLLFQKIDGFAAMQPAQD